MAKATAFFPFGPFSRTVRIAIAPRLEGGGVRRRLPRVRWDAGVPSNPRIKGDEAASAHASVETALST